jgi:TPR repeat protein
MLNRTRSTVRIATVDSQSNWLGSMIFALFLLGLLLISGHAEASIGNAQRNSDKVELSLRTSGLYGEIFELAMEAYREHNYTAAIHLWQPIAESGYAAAQYNLGVAHARGLSVPKNMILAGDWWRAAANQGNADAQYNLGLLYATGNGVEMSMEKAVHWWQQAASIGDPAAQFNLGMMYARGDGVSKNMDAALHWWSQSAAQKFPQAQHLLDRISKR